MLDIAQEINALDHCLVLARHAQTPFNVDDLLTTYSDPPITEQGVDVAIERSQELAGVVFDHCWSSPRQRAQTTGQLLTAHATLKSGFVIDDRLAEPSAGPALEGKPFSDFRGGDQELTKIFQAYAQEVNPVFPDGAKTSAEISAELNEFMQEVIATPGRHFVSTHGALARMLGCELLGHDINFYRRLKLANCGMALFKFYADGSNQMIFWNR